MSDVIKTDSPMLKNTCSITISRKLLLGIYAVIPISLLVILVDYLFFNMQFKVNSGYNPDSYAFFTLLFTLPHIISSFLSFFDKEYVDAYGKKLLRGAQYTALLAIVLPVISLHASFFVFALLTMIHVFRQQSGIYKSLSKGANSYHTTWELFGVLLSLVLYIAIYRGDVLFFNWQVLFFILLLPYSYYGYRASKHSASASTRAFFWLTHSIPLVSGLYHSLGYTILAIAIPRIIHDVTAFVFYVTHDVNRFSSSRSNRIYKYTSNVKIPVAVANVVLSVGIAAMMYTLPAGSVYFLLMFLFLYHYYTESFIWKKDTLHSRYIRIV